MVFIHMNNIYIFPGSFQSCVVYVILLQYVFIMKVENTETSISMFSHKYHSIFLLPKYRLHNQCGTISDTVLLRVLFRHIN
jgi:hypothetical protein